MENLEFKSVNNFEVDISNNITAQDKTLQHLFYRFMSVGSHSIYQSA